MADPPTRHRYIKVDHIIGERHFNLAVAHDMCGELEANGVAHDHAADLPLCCKLAARVHERCAHSATRWDPTVGTLCADCGDVLLRVSR